MLLGLVGLSYLFFDPLVKHIVLKRLVLRNHSEFAEIWSNPPITPHLKVINILFMSQGRHAIHYSNEICLPSSLLQ